MAWTYAVGVVVRVSCMATCGGILYGNTRVCMHVALPLMSHVSCLMSHAPCLMPHVSCLMCACLALSFWRVLQVVAEDTPGHFKLWVLLDDGALRSVTVVVPRTIYLNFRKPNDSMGPLLNEERTSERAYEHTSERANERTSGRADERTSGRVNE